MRLSSVLKNLPASKNSGNTSQDPHEQNVSRSDLKQLENYLDQLWKAANINVEFPQHFFDRLNDDRNGKQITVGELKRIFSDAFKKYSSQFSKIKDFEGVLKSISTAINVPFALDFDRRTHMLDLVAKTVMRKRDFKTPDKTFAVESKNVVT